MKENRSRSRRISGEYQKNIRTYQKRTGRFTGERDAGRTDRRESAMSTYEKKRRTGFAALFGIWMLCLWMISGCVIHAEEEKHTIRFFFENVCASCHEEDDFIDLFNRCITEEEKATISYELRTYNVFLDSNLEAYEKLLAEEGKQRSDFALPVLYVDGEWLSGYDTIEKELHHVLIGDDAGQDKESKTDETENQSSKAGETDGTESPDSKAGETKLSDSEGSETDNADESENSDLLAALPAIRAADDENVVLLFTTYSCDDCSEIKDELSRMQEDTAFVISEANVAEGENIRLFKQLLTVYGREETDGKVPAVFAGTHALLGKEEIREELPGLLADGSAGYDSLKAQLSGAAKGAEAVSMASMATLFGAGLLAGFNPCSISMLLMLFSILLTTHSSVWKNGMLYLLGKYITYLGLGVVICFAAAQIDQSVLSRFGTAVSVVLVVLFAAAAGMNFMDFLHVRKQEYGRVRMQLPRFLRHFNHQILKKASGLEGVLLGMLVLGLGIAVSLGEFFCTGQIYMASIVYLLQNAQEQLAAIFGALLVYVTAMSIPAAVIVLIIGRTKGTGRVSDFMLKHMGAVKVLNCLLFLFYAVYFIIQMVF